MELHTGIDLAVELLRQNNLPTLLKVASRQLENTFGLTRCWSLELDLSGRTLHCAALGEQGEFDCGDFSHPFAHLLQQGKPRELSRAASYRLDHQGFQAMVEASNRPRSFWLEPIKGEDGRTLGILVLCNEEPEWEGITAQPLYRGLLTLLAHQWVSQLRSSDQVWQRRLLKRSLDHLHDAESMRQRCEQLSGTLVGNSMAMTDLRFQIIRAAASQLSVLVQGETGCGKDLVAQGIHQFSGRAKGPMVVVNCAAIPDSLLESELFGHEKGAFTGAAAARQGRFEQANSGTLFLDEIGDMPADTQTRLLRVLADGEFYRVGGTTPIKVDVRIIAATHQDLEKLVQAGTFREDLFHRLNVIRVHLPKLSERREDIPRLMQHFLKSAAKELAVETKLLRPEAEEYLTTMPWPGNVRQLENTCRWLTVMASGREVHIDDLPPELMQQAETPATGQTWQEGLRSWAEQELKRGRKGILDTAVPEFERIMIETALKHTGGRRRDASILLGWGRNTLTRKINELGMDQPEGEED